MLGVRVPLRSRHFLSLHFRHFHKNIRSWVENECCCPRTLNIPNVNFTSKMAIYILMSSQIPATDSTHCKHNDQMIAFVTPFDDHFWTTWHNWTHSTRSAQYFKVLKRLPNMCYNVLVRQYMFQEHRKLGCILPHRVQLVQPEKNSWAFR